MSKFVAEYEVIEPTVGVMMPLMELAESDPKQMQFKLAQTCVLKDGKPIGEALNDLPMSTYLKLVTAIMSMVSGDEGK